jgi:hypothetical protein
MVRSTYDLARDTMYARLTVSTTFSLGLFMSIF